MKTETFQNLLFKSAVSAIACDGEIHDAEIDELKKMADNEIYFMGFDYQGPLANNLNYIKEKGKIAINEYLVELSVADLNDNQELLLIEVLINAIESDKKVETSEIKFLQLVKSKLKIREETLITSFPNHINYLLGSDNNIIKEFNEEINFE